jgi:hypothetical protein
LLFQHHECGEDGSGSTGAQQHRQSGDQVRNQDDHFFHKQVARGGVALEGKSHCRHPAYEFAMYRQEAMLKVRQG